MNGGFYECSFTTGTHTHSMTLVAKVEPTCKDTGKQAYYHCSTCSKDFEDVTGAIEITNISTWGIIGKLTTHQTPTSWTNSGSTRHWGYCPVCHTSISESHDLTETVTKNTAATFDTDGEKTTKTACSKCDYEKMETIITPAGKYIRESAATMTPGTLTSSMCANDLSFTSADPSRYTVTLYNQRVYDRTDGFRVIIMTQANSQVNTRVLELLPKFKIKKMNRWCAV